MIVGQTPWLRQHAGMCLQELGRGADICAVLLSRSPCASKEELVALADSSIASFGIGCDAGNPAAVARVLEWAHEHLPVVETLAHAAGALGYDAIANVTPEAFWTVCRPKACLSSVSASAPACCM